ncbi:hypothetical protein [Thermogymnomonas acidicola]|uniref:hypothetical protein n=1 Tax=Thermogymnomonas acidicola TaxID=399579 RepID=UPI0009462553|nr:hypothetical protein [Thermogymnomonas acidicola]
MINGSAIANFTQTIGMEVLITGSNLSNGTSIGIIGSIYSEMPPLNVVKPKTSDSLFYDVKVLNVSSGNATVSITESFVKTEHMNTMEYWNGTAWVQASSIVVVNDTIQGVIPVKELQKTPIVIVHSTAVAPCRLPGRGPCCCGGCHNTATHNTETQEAAATATAGG